MRTPCLFSLFVTFVIALSATAQVPHMISYQGYVTVEGRSYHRDGYFKFALVNSNATRTYWTHDGTGFDDSEPVSAIILPVVRGLFTVNLGDSSVSNMQPMSPLVFTNSDVHLRTWFSDGRDGWHLLAPDRKLVSVAYAMAAATVPDGSITAAKIAPGAVLQNLASSGQSMVPSGGIVLSLESNSTALANAGYAFAGVLPLGRTTDNWEIRSSALSARQLHRAVWTGSEMIVWGGGGNGVWMNTGGRYNPAADSWQVLPTLGAPAGRWRHAAVWTGTEMLVWGGSGVFTPGVNQRGDGALYNPTSNNWRTMNTNGSPSPRTYFAYAWTGTELLVWGGIGNSYANLGDGARYNPQTDTWTPMAAAGAPSARLGMAWAWSGTEFILWGGGISYGTTWSNAAPTGARYNPQSNTWLPMATNGAPAPRSSPACGWTGNRMIVWGGDDHDRRASPGRPATLGDGALYDPVTDSWTPMSLSNAPMSRAEFSSAWTGSEFWIGGGRHEASTGMSYLASGAFYDPANDRWRVAAPAPVACANASVTWTSASLLMFGGYNGADLNGHYAWRPPGNVLYLYQRQ